MWLLYECDRCSFPAGCARLISDESRPGNSSPKKPWSFLKPPLGPLVLEPWLLAVVVILAIDGRRSSEKYDSSGESALVPEVCDGRVVAGRTPGETCELIDRLSVESL